MDTRLIGRVCVEFLAAVAIWVLVASGLSAAPYADFVIDARTGEVLHSENADTRLHPASLTKMMTLYIAFEAIERGEISLDSRVTVSEHAASQPPSKLGLKAGQKIALRYLIRAAAIKSANDAATAIGEAIEGSESAFAKRMNRTAAALGMDRSTFRNANGLTAEGHLSTARDMTTLGRHLFYDFPQYYNIFSRRSADAGVAQVASTNRRFLDSYEGADGIKTGYTVPAGFNLTASAQRGNKRIIATVFGGKSSATRNARIAELLDIGFGKAPNKAVTQEPAKPDYNAVDDEEDQDMLASAVADAVAKGLDEPAPAAGKTIRVSAAIARSPRPAGRPVAGAASETPALLAEAAPAAQEEGPSDEMLLAMADSIGAALKEVAEEPVFEQTTPAQPETAALLPEETALAAAETEPLPEVAVADAAATPADDGFAQTTAPQPETLAAVAPATPPVEGTVLPDAAPAIQVATAGETDARPRARPAAAADATVIAEVAAPPEEAPAETAIATAPLAPAPSPVAPAAEASGVVIASALPQILPLAGETTADSAEIFFETPPAESPAAEALETITVAAAPQPSVDEIILTAVEPVSASSEEDLEVVTRVSTSGGRQWGVNVGRYPSSYEAEQVLLKTALVEMNTLGDALRKVANRKGGFEANFMGLTQETAELACRRLAARATTCTVMGPEG
ncbi:MAG: hypothetical protein RLZZ528_2809 [Pseudomonadota bacterium]